MWTYQQSTGFLTHKDCQWIGYSGTGLGRNNALMQDVHNVGPIPQGLWLIGEAYDEIPGTGPCTLPLSPAPDTQTFGRSLFRIHGDNPEHDASHGCVVAGPAVRNLISTSSDKQLLVIC